MSEMRSLLYGYHGPYHIKYIHRKRYDNYIAFYTYSKGRLIQHDRVIINGVQNRQKGFLLK